jgi:hypothetical protein
VVRHTAVLTLQQLQCKVSSRSKQQQQQVSQPDVEGDHPADDGKQQQQQHQQQQLARS